MKRALSPWPSGLFLATAVLAAVFSPVPAWCETAPPAAPVVLHLVPPEQRLTLVRVFEHGDPLTKLVFGGLMVATVAALGVWLVQQLRIRRAPPASLARSLDFLSMLVVAAPLFGLTRAAYEVMKVCMGLVNLRPAPDLVMLAPAFAEASMSILLGVCTAAIAATLRGALMVTRPSGPRS